MPVRKKTRIVKKRIQRMRSITANRMSGLGELADLANFYIAGIVRRTQRGKSANGAAFKPYTNSYRNSKSKTRQGAARVNLTVTGEMLNSITVKKTKDGFKLLFINPKQNLKAVGNQKKRPFFGLDKKQQSYLKKYLLQKFKKR